MLQSKWHRIKEINPFIVTGKILPEYFCDRVVESERLIRSVTNGNNLVIISPSRMGKAGLIQFCYDKPEIKDIYVQFIVDNFEKRGRKISAENAAMVYDLFKGHTFYIQKTFNEAFADTPKGEQCTEETIRTAINSMVALYDTIFREILSQIPERQK